MFFKILKKIVKKLRNRNNEKPSLIEKSIKKLGLTYADFVSFVESLGIKEPQFYLPIYSKSMQRLDFRCIDYFKRIYRFSIVVPDRYFSPIIIISDKNDNERTYLLKSEPLLISKYSPQFIFVNYENGLDWEVFLDERHSLNVSLKGEKLKSLNHKDYISYTIESYLLLIVDMHKKGFHLNTQKVYDEIFTIVPDIGIEINVYIMENAKKRNIKNHNKGDL